MEHREAADLAGRLHPASTRILQLWTKRLAELGIPERGLRTHRRPQLALDPLVRLLAEHGLGIDHRAWSGPVYLDGTAHGLPLRQLVGADGHPNYLAGLLRELVPLLGAYDAFVLVCDRDSLPDYTLLRYILTRLGAPAVSITAIGRVRTDATAGRPLSSRHGGWEGHTGAALAEQLLDRVGPQVYRLGLRLYFIATLGLGDAQPHRPDLVRRCMARARRLLVGDARDGAWAVTGDRLRRFARPHGFVDPYRLTTTLLARDGALAGRLLLEKVYL
jgi:hypothetical protein